MLQIVGHKIRKAVPQSTDNKSLSRSVPVMYEIRSVFMSILGPSAKLYNSIKT